MRSTTLTSSHCACTPRNAHTVHRCRHKHGHACGQIHPHTAEIHYIHLCSCSNNQQSSATHLTYRILPTQEELDILYNPTHPTPPIHSVCTRTQTGTNMHRRARHTAAERHSPSTPRRSSPRGSGSPRWPPSHTQTQPCPRSRPAVMSCSSSGSSQELRLALCFPFSVKKKKGSRTEKRRERGRGAGREIFLSRLRATDLPSASSDLLITSLNRP